MIFVCLGASEYSFDRLLKIIDELCEQGILKKDEIVAQIGYSRYVPKNYKYFDLISREEYQTYVDAADIIISHAGTGSVVPPLKFGKKVILFPRLLNYNEHLDNHQLELADVFTQAGYTLCANNKDELIIALDRVSKFQPKKFISNNQYINQLIIDFIEKI